MREFAAFIGLLSLLSIATMIGWGAGRTLIQPPPPPVPHDVCTLGPGPEPKCVVMSFDGSQRIEDGQVWATEPDGSVQYMADVFLVRKCFENCEVGGSF